MPNLCTATKEDDSPCKSPTKAGYVVCDFHRRTRAEKLSALLEEHVQERDSKIIALYVDEQQSLGKIARAVGLTPEGVRLVLKKHDVRLRSRAEAADVTKKRQRSAVDPDLVVAEYKRLHSVKEVAESLDIGTTLVSEIVRKRVPEVERRAQPKQMTKDPERRAKEFLVAAYAFVAKDNETMSRPMYDKWAARNNAPQARTLVVQTGFDGWHSLCAFAGVPTTNYREKPGPQRLWSNEQLLGHVRRVARELGRVPTYAEYEERSRGDEKLASGSLIRRHISRQWVEVLRRAVPKMVDRKEKVAA